MKTPNELFVFSVDGHWVHVHSDRSVFEDWMERSPWLYPPDRSEIIRFVPSEIKES